MTTQRNATLANPILLPLAGPADAEGVLTVGGYAIVADDAPGPYLRIGDVERDGRKWLAWPMGAEMKTPFRTRREAVEFVVRVATS